MGGGVMESDDIERHPADRWRGALLCTAVLLTGVCYSLRLTSFLHAKEAVLSLVVVVMAVLAVAGRRDLWRGWAAFLPLWLLVGYGFVVHVCLWPCAVRSAAVLAIVRWAVPLLALALSYDLLLTACWRRRVLNAIMATASVASVLALLQFAGWAEAIFPSYGGTAHRVYSVFGNADLLGGYLAIAFPLLFHRASLKSRRPRASAAMVCVVVAALLISGSRTAWLAAAMGTLFVLPHPQRCPRATGILVSGAAIIAIAAALVAPRDTVHRLTATMSTADHGGRLRLWFWDGSLRMAGDHWALGVGPGNYAYWSPKYLGEALHAPGGDAHAHNELHTIHAHADPLELLAEYGVGGVLLVAWMAARLMRCRGPEWGGLAALLVFSTMNFPFHSAPHALAGLALAGMLMARRAGRMTLPARGSSLAAGILALTLALIVCIATLWGVVAPSFRLRRAEDAHLAGVPCLELYRAAVNGAWASANAHEKYGIALLEGEDFSEAEAQYRRAVKGLDTGGGHLALGALCARRGAAGEARRHLTRCIARWPSSADAWLLLVRASPVPERAGIIEAARRWLSPEDIARLEAVSATLRGE